MTGADGIDALRARLSGDAFEPGDPEYDEARRGWELADASQPAVVVLPEGSDDVAAAVDHARDAGLGIGVKGTGHAGLPCEGGLLLNMSRMTGISIDPEARTARIEAGVKWGNVVVEAEPHGLVPVTGHLPKVGAVGFTLRGGHGWLCRSFGLGADSLRAVELVGADGEATRVDEDSEPELLWAARGAGGGLGVACAIEVELHPCDALFGGRIAWPLERAESMLERYAEWVAGLPENATAGTQIMRLPPDPAIPEPIRGKSIVTADFCARADADAGEALVAPMRGLDGAIVDSMRPLKPSEMGTISADPVDPTPTMGRGEFLSGETSSVLDAILDVAGPGEEVPLANINVRQLGGAVATNGADSPIANRDSDLLLFAVAPLLAPGAAEAVGATIERLTSALKPFSAGGVLPSFLVGADPPERLRTCYTPEALERLGRIAEQRDPDTLFRFNSQVR